VAWKQSAEAKAKISAAKRLLWQDAEYRDKASVSLANARSAMKASGKRPGRKVGSTHTVESRALMSERMIAIRARETPEQRSGRLRGRVLSDETKAKIAAAHTGMRHTAEARAKMSATKRAMKIRLSPERRAEISAMFKGRPAPYPNRRFYYKGLAFRSSWEVRAATAMDALGIQWEYESRRFDLVSQTYAPDFYLPEQGAYWEIKGYYGPKSQRTIQLFREQYPEVPLVLLTERGLRMLEHAAFQTRAA
jgi:hypothetical protein